MFGCAFVSVREQGMGSHHPQPEGHQARTVTHRRRPTQGHWQRQAEVQD